MIRLSSKALVMKPIVRCSDEDAERYSGEKRRTVRGGYQKLLSRTMNQLGMALGVLFLIRLITGKESK